MAVANTTTTEIIPCKRCGEKRSADKFRVGRRGMPISPCNPCRREISKRWDDAHPEQKKEKRLAWQSRNRERHNQHSKAYLSRNWGKKIESQRIYRANNKLKSAARRAVAYAIARGRLQRLPCSKCGTTIRVQAHHHDYNLPLDVVWLCPLHHAEMHPQKVATKERDCSELKC
jgi:hypothetical protein